MYSVSVISENATVSAVRLNDQICDANICPGYGQIDLFGVAFWMPELASYSFRLFY